MTSSSVVVVGSDTTMVYDALRNAVAAALGVLDPSVALEDFVAKEVSASRGSVVSSVLEALNTPPFLVERRVVVVRDAQLLLADESAMLIEWMKAPAPAVVLILAVVGAKSNRLVKAASEVIEVNVGSRAPERASFIESTLERYRVSVDRTALQRIGERVGDDVARVDALARTLSSIYGTAPLSFAHVEPYLGDAGDVPEWDLTDAIDAGDATRAIVVARRMLDSKSRAGLQIVNILQRYFTRLTRLEGSGARSDEDAAALLGINKYPAGKALRSAERLGASRIVVSIHMITRADMDLKGGVSFGGKDLNTDLDATELTVIEVLVARLARLSRAGRQR